MDKYIAGTPIGVQYQYVDGAHFFTTNNPDFEGLCAASPDLAVAFKEVALQLKALAKLNHGVDGNFAPTASLEDLLAWIERHQQRQGSTTIRTLAAAEWQQGRAA